LPQTGVPVQIRLCKSASEILHQLSRRTAKDPALKVVGSMKPRTNANENATAESQSTLYFAELLAPICGCGG
jgi:hypothetical protein